MCIMLSTLPHTNRTWTVSSDAFLASTGGTASLRILLLLRFLPFVTQPFHGIIWCSDKSMIIIETVVLPCLPTLNTQIKSIFNEFPRELFSKLNCCFLHRKSKFVVRNLICIHLRDRNDECKHTIWPLSGLPSFFKRARKVSLWVVVVNTTPVFVVPI